jgi:Fe-S-cluster containining protein
MDKEVPSSRTHCIQCGECCLGSSPTLQMDDVSLVKDGFIEKCDLYTIRVGEPVRDNVENRLTITDREIIKVKEREEGVGCIYYDEDAKACRTYDHRPAQCAALACWDPAEFMRVYKRPGANRKAIIYDKVILALMDEHERKCSYSRLDRYARQIEQKGEEAVGRILEALRFDHHIRAFTSKKLGIDLSEMGFLFGRPLTQTITMFGLKVIKKSDGSFFLTVLDSPYTS